MFGQRPYRCYTTKSSCCSSFCGSIKIELQQKATLFQGETLRGILLTSGYGFGTVGLIAGYMAYAMFGLAVAALVGIAWALSRR